MCYQWRFFNISTNALYSPDSGGYSALANVYIGTNRDNLELSARTKKIFLCLSIKTSPWNPMEILCFKSLFVLNVYRALSFLYSYVLTTSVYTLPTLKNPWLSLRSSVYLFHVQANVWSREKMGLKKTFSPLRIGGSQQHF